MLQPDQDVICIIEWEPPAEEPGFVLVKKGEIYKIRHVYIEVLPDGAEIVHATVQEIINQSCPICGYEHGFPVRGFRPLSKRSLEIVEDLKTPIDAKTPLEVAFQ